MTNDVYAQLAKVLDTLPNGFPRTDSAWKSSFSRDLHPPQAELFGRLRLTFETVEEIAPETACRWKPERPLMGMAVRGQVFTIKPGGVRRFRMLPWVIDLRVPARQHGQEFAELNEEYWPYLRNVLFRHAAVDADPFRGGNRSFAPGSTAL